MNRCALIITHAFPPAGGPGVQRMLKFVKYLPECGWRPVVLTATPDAYEVVDDTMMGDVPAATPVHRVADSHINRLRPAFNRFKLGKVLSALNVAMQLPDEHRCWAAKARATAWRLVAQYQPAVVLSSSPPASAHRLAMWIRRRRQVTWVADFRDPWSGSPQIRYYPGYRALNRRMERRVLGCCDHVTTVSPQLVEMFQRLSERPPGHVTLIENGYDESEVEPLPPPRTERFTITYAGTFSRRCRPDAFVTAVTRLVSAQRIPRHELRVALAGQNVAAYVPDRPPFENLGYVSHSTLKDLRRESDLLLLVLDEAPPSRGVYSGKVFEHLGCNRPTLCITHPENVAAKLIGRARGGVVVPPRPTAIAEAISRYHRVWKSGVFDYDPDWEIIRQFTRRRLTRRLAETFERRVRDGESHPFR
jgi:glycosyltransferase involved in cell wall biosynthesis